MDEGEAGGEWPVDACCNEIGCDVRFMRELWMVMDGVWLEGQVVV